MDFVRNRLGKVTDLAYRLKALQKCRAGYVWAGESGGFGPSLFLGVCVFVYFFFVRRLGFCFCCCVFWGGKVSKIKKNRLKIGLSFGVSCYSTMIISGCIFSRCIPG